MYFQGDNCCVIWPIAYTVKKRFAIFPSPAGISLTKLSLAGRAWLVTSMLGTGKIANFILQCMQNKVELATIRHNSTKFIGHRLLMVKITVSLSAGCVVEFNFVTGNIAPLSII
jgi:hypothetical protein